MPSRRQIREAAVQLLYSADFDGRTTPDLPGDAFWDLVAGPDRMRLMSSTARALLHAAHGQDTRVRSFAERWQSLRPRVIAHPSGDVSASALDRIDELTPAWSAALAALERLPKPADDPAALVPLQSALDAVFLHNRTLLAACGRMPEPTDLPSPLRGWLEPVEAAVRKLRECCARIDAVEHAENHPDDAGLNPIRNARNELLEWRLRSEETARRVLARLDPIDAEIAGTVEHYSPERIDAIDRAILRLAIDELMGGDTPTKVVINEAIELAKRFGTSESGRFVNGVLDPIAHKTGKPREETFTPVPADE